jgi:hypothetical protein
MARPETLIPGNCYFSVGYYDSGEHLRIIKVNRRATERDLPIAWSHSVNP